MFMIAKKFGFPTLTKVGIRKDNGPKPVLGSKFLILL